MKVQSMRRVVGFTAAMGLVVGLLSACMSLDYVLNVNADSTMSGTLKVAIAKQAASVLGITSADGLLEEANSGDATSGMGLDVAKDCASSEDETNFILTCTFANAKASDIDEGWSMTTEGDTASLHVVSNIDQAAAETDPAAFEMPDMNMGSYNFTINFPGKITKVTGTGAKQTSDTTVVAKGGLNDTIDFTVTGSTSSGSGLPWWSYLVIGLIAGAVVVAIIGLVRRGKKDETTSEAAPEPTTEATPEATTSTEIAEPPAT